MQRFLSSPRIKRVTLACLAVMSLPMSALASAEEDLWSNTADAPTAQQAEPEARKTTSVTSSIGIGLGEYVTFKGVGTIFYAGRAGGDVYFASNDIPGGLTWPEAMEACRRKGAGWALPTLDQLHLLYRHSDELDLYALGVEPTSGNWYWSSSVYDEENAWRERFFDGHQLYTKKRYAARARCARVY